jgi:hypothetical protein
MQSTSRSTRRTRALAIGAGCIAVAALPGCGSDNKDYKNSPRPAVPIIVTAAINRDQVALSPKVVGAGPISLIVANETGAAQQVTLESEGLDKKGLKQETGPINPTETATLKADIEQGTYSVHVAGDGIRPATLRVGAKRPSAQNDLLQP